MMPSTPPVDEARHVGRVVHGPRQHLQAQRVRLGHALRREIAPEHRPRAQPAACTSRGTEPPCRASVKPGVPRRGRRRSAACTVSLFARLDRQARGRDVRRELLHLDQRAPVERLHASRAPSKPASRIASTTSCANVAGSTVSSPLRRRDLGLDVEAHAACRCAHEREQLARASESARRPRLLLRELLRVAARRIERGRRRSASSSAASAACGSRALRRRATRRRVRARDRD